MTPEAALIELLGRVGARLGESVTVSTEELNQWPAAAVSALKSQGLLLKARPAKSVILRRVRTGLQHARANSDPRERIGHVLRGV
jgi:hypothetical protein